MSTESTGFFGLPYDALGSAAPLLSTLRDRADRSATEALQALRGVPSYMLRVGLKVQSEHAFNAWTDLLLVRSVAEALAAEVVEARTELVMLRCPASDADPELMALADAAHKLWAAVEQLHAAEMNEMRALAEEACVQRKAEQSSAVERDPARRGIRHRLRVFRADIEGIRTMAEGVSLEHARRRWMQMRAGLVGDPVLNERERGGLIADGDAIFVSKHEGENTAPLPQDPSSQTTSRK
jgi:hypothetical protein